MSDSLGHSSAQITLDIYGIAADKVARAAADDPAGSFGIDAGAALVEAPQESRVVALR